MRENKNKTLKHNPIILKANSFVLSIRIIKFSNPKIVSIGHSSRFTDQLASYKAQNNLGWFMFPRCQCFSFLEMQRIIPLRRSLRPFRQLDDFECGRIIDIWK